MTPTYYLHNGQLFEIDRMPPDMMNRDHRSEGPTQEEWDDFRIYLSTLQPIPHAFTGESRVVPEDQIEWEFEQFYCGQWVKCRQVIFDKLPNNIRRKVAVPKEAKDDEIVAAMEKRISEISKSENHKKDKQRRASAEEISDLKKEKSLPKDDNDPEGEEIYCEKCKKDTYQVFINEGMKCADCSAINPFGNCSKEDFARYIKDLSLRNDFRSVDDINAYFDKKRKEIDAKFDEYIASHPPATPELPNLSASTANWSKIKDKDAFMEEVRGEEDMGNPITESIPPNSGELNILDEDFPKVLEEKALFDKLYEVREDLDNIHTALSRSTVPMEVYNLFSAALGKAKFDILAIHKGVSHLHTGLGECEIVLNEFREENSKLKGNTTGFAEWIDPDFKYYGNSIWRQHTGYQETTHQLLSKYLKSSPIPSTPEPPPSKPETISTEGDDDYERYYEYAEIGGGKKWDDMSEVERLKCVMNKRKQAIEMYQRLVTKLRSHHPHSPSGSDEERDISEVIEENHRLKTAIDKLTEALKLVREIHQPPQEQAGREARGQIEEILTKHGVSLTEAVYITDEIISLFTPAPSSVSNPVAFAEWVELNFVCIRDTKDGNIVRLSWQRVNPSYDPKELSSSDLYALFTSQPTEQGPDQEKLWDEVYTIAVNNYNDHNYVSQGVKELMKRFHITPKQ